VHRVNSDGIRCKSYFFDPEDEELAITHPGSADAIRAAIAPACGDMGGLLLGFLWEYGIKFDSAAHIVSVDMPGRASLASEPSREEASRRLNLPAQFNASPDAVHPARIRREGLVDTAGLGMGGGGGSGGSAGRGKRGGKAGLRGGREREVSRPVPGFEVGRPVDPHASMWSADGFKRRVIVDVERGWVWTKASLEVEDPFETTYCVSHPVKPATWRAMRCELLRFYAIIARRGQELEDAGVTPGSARWADSVQTVLAELKKPPRREPLVASRLVSSWDGAGTVFRAHKYADEPVKAPEMPRPAPRPAAAAAPRMTRGGAKSTGERVSTVVTAESLMAAAVPVPTLRPPSLGLPVPTLPVPGLAAPSLPVPGLAAPSLPVAAAASGAGRTTQTSGAGGGRAAPRRALRGGLVPRIIANSAGEKALRRRN
jgi:hypothetical protein